MINSRELRLNNIVYGVSDRIEKITYITERYVKTNLLKIDAESQILYVENLNPIPLDRMLFIFGFTEDKMTYKLETKKFIIELFFHDIWHLYYKEKKDFGDAKINLKGYWSTHEFQNLIFYLTNSELTINN